MKTIITSSGNRVTSQFDKRFGRSAWFCLYDESTGKYEFLKNDHADEISGSGTKIAEKMIELNVQKVISGDFGPKARRLLDKFNIQMVIIPDDNSTVEDILNKLK